MKCLVTSLKLFTLACIFLCFVQKVYSQSNGPKRLLGSFIFQRKAFNYEFTMEASDSYSFNITAAKTIEQGADQVSDSASVDTPTRDTAKTIGIPFNEFSKQVFESVFITEMDEYIENGQSLNDVATEVFYKIKNRMDFIDDEPITAYFILNKDSVNSFLQYNASKFYDGRLSWAVAGHYVQRVEAETEDGALKNITAYMVAKDAVKNGKSSPRQFLIFKNRFPISMSGKFDYEKFSNIDLYCDNCNGVEGLSRFIRLMDLVTFDITYANEKEDYSPANRTFALSPTHSIEELRKDRRSRLLEVAAFTDFVGLDRNEPNGLLQFEAKRRINLNTKYRLLKRGMAQRLTEYDLSKVRFERADKVTRYWSYYVVLKKDTSKSKWLHTGDTSKYKWIPSRDTVKVSNRKFRSPYFNFLGYIEPKLLFSKLEETNRFVDSGKAVGGVMNPIDLYRYQIASFGIDVQLFRISFPQLKLQWNMVNSGLFWSRTRVALTSDSAGPTKALNSNFWRFGSSLIFRPDSRWGAAIGFDYIIPRIWDDEYKLTNRNGLFQDQFDAWFKTSSEGKLFFRFRRTYESHKLSHNFTQIQLGYSLNLFVGNEETSKKRL